MRSGKGRDGMKLRVGAGRGTIFFPRELFPLEGFQDVHDAPAVRVLLLECGEQAALVSLELVMLPPELVDLVKDLVTEVTGVTQNRIWVHTTHAITTPHAPHAPVGPGGVAKTLSPEETDALKEKTQLYRTALAQAVREAAGEAKRSVCPAAMGVARGDCHISVNRDVPTPFGWWIGQNPLGPTDNTLDILRFADNQGATLAVAVFAGIKPCAIDNSQMAQGKRLVSSDVPGAACRLVEKALRAPCLFFMGAAGDQVPREQALLDRVDENGVVHSVDLGVAAGLAMVERLGEELAENILHGLKNLNSPKEPMHLQMEETAISCQAKQRTDMAPRKTASYIPVGEVQVPVRLLALGNVALVGTKPELNCVTARQLKAASPYAATLVVSMVDGGMKYMPDAESYQNVTWEAQNAMVMPGGAEKWVAVAEKKLRQMKGREKHE